MRIVNSFEILRRRVFGCIAVGAVLFLLNGCGTTHESASYRLVEHFADASVQDTPTSVPAIPSPKWGDGGKEDLSAWKAGAGFASLKLQDNLLVGKTSTKVPLIYVEKPATMDEADSIHALEVTLRVSKGSRIEAETSTQGELKIDELAKEAAKPNAAPASMGTTLLPGDSFQTYVLNRRPSPATSTARIRHFIIRPTDEPDAEVEIRSIRVIYRKEHLLSTPTGVSWEGMANVYRESLVSRAPERVVFDADVPEQPWLDLAIASLEGGPVTFSVSVETGGAREVVFQKTLTTPHRWEETPVELDRFAGRNVKVGLELQASAPGTLGVWGSPVIRSHSQGALRSAGSTQGGTAKRPRGVILIVGDTLRRDHLDVYGYDKPTAPNLTTLAHEGVLFKDNQSQATWTKVSVPSILTSLYPTTHGVVSIPDRISAAAETAAEVYKAAGFATWASSSVPFSGQLTNLHQGVEVLYERPSIAEPGAKTARPFIDHLLPWLSSHREDPFFVFLHVFDPHSPFEPRPPYNRMWVTAEEGQEHQKLWDRVEKHMKSDFFKGQKVANLKEIEAAGVDPDAFQKALLGWYDGSIRGMDDEIERVLEGLDRLGLREDTLIAFTSDHGEAFLEHGYAFHGTTAHGDMTNVPLLLNWPGTIPAGVVVEDTTQSIDLLPTLLELSGLEIPESYQGKSLVPYFMPNGDAARLAELRGRPAFSERRVSSDADEEYEKRESFAVVHDGWKLIHNTKTVEGVPEFELFDHRQDPWNRTNVATEHPDVVERLSKLLDGYLETTMAARLSPEDATEGLSEEDLQHLRALGYVQ